MADINYYCRMLWLLSNNLYNPPADSTSENEQNYFKSNLTSLVSYL